MMITGEDSGSSSIVGDLLCLFSAILFGLCSVRTVSSKPSTQNSKYWMHVHCRFVQALFLSDFCPALIKTLDPHIESWSWHPHAFCHVTRRRSPWNTFRATPWHPLTHFHCCQYQDALAHFSILIILRNFSILDQLRSQSLDTASFWICQKQTHKLAENLSSYVLDTKNS